MNLIMAVDKDWNIGNKNKLLVHIPDDLKRFKELTEHKVVIMGRNTFESLPDGKPLLNRFNIVVSKTLSMDGRTKYRNRQMCVVNDTESLKTIYTKHGQDAEVFVIGGEQIINQFMDVIKTAYITKIDNVYEADTKIPNLDNELDWILVDQSEWFEHENVKYCYCKYERIGV